MRTGREEFLGLVEVDERRPGRDVAGDSGHLLPDVVDVPVREVRDDVPGHEDPAVVASPGRWV